MTEQNIIELLNDNRYPTHIDLSSPLGYLLLRSFDHLIAEDSEWLTVSPSLASQFSKRKRGLTTVAAIGTLTPGRTLATRYALSVDETADTLNHCNYREFCAAMMHAWVKQRLPTEEILALLVDARACVDYRYGVKGLHRIH